MKLCTGDFLVGLCNGDAFVEGIDRFLILSQIELGAAQHLVIVPPRIERDQLVQSVGRLLPIFSGEFGLRLAQQGLARCRRLRLGGQGYDGDNAKQDRRNQNVLSDHRRLRNYIEATIDLNPMPPNPAARSA